jgi:hypothetical protein
MGNLPVIQYLNFGVLGLCALILGYAVTVIRKEQQREGEPRKGILRWSYVFLGFSLVLAALSGYVQLRQPPASSQAGGTNDVATASLIATLQTTTNNLAMQAEELRQRLALTGEKQETCERKYEDLLLANTNLKKASNSLALATMSLQQTNRMLATTVLRLDQENQALVTKQQAIIKMVPKTVKIPESLLRIERIRP